MHDLSNEHIFTVSELNQQTRLLLETHFSSLWIEGEISNFSCPSSGHWYFSLKDSQAQIRCAMFRPYHRPLKFQPQDGMHVLVRAKVSLYVGRGDYQLIAEHMEEMGFGALQRAFEQLKAQLLKEGLFDEQYKKYIPHYPQCIGIITSPTGAAIRDILSVLKRRFPMFSAIIYPTLVQGNEAAQQIKEAITLANQQACSDVLILARGGGSLEDLWPFNEEIVARAIFKSKIPIVTGIGHEVDFTIADFVADHRAPTPSSAAEFVSPDHQEIRAQLNRYQQQLHSSLIKCISQEKSKLTWLIKRFEQAHPLRQLQEKSQKLDYLTGTLYQAETRLIEKKKIALQSFMKNLNHLNPLSILERGYAVLMNGQKEVIHDCKNIKTGEQVQALLHQCELLCTIDEIKKII